MLWPSEKLLNLPKFSPLAGADRLRVHMFLPISSSGPLGVFFPLLSPQEQASSSPSFQHFELQHPILKQPHGSIGQPGSPGQNLDGMEARGNVRVLALRAGVRTRVKWVWLVSECPDDTAGTYPAVRHTPCKSHYGDTQSSRSFKNTHMIHDCIQNKCSYQLLKKHSPPFARHI